MAHLLLSGYFGSGNIGDDAIMLGFVQGLGNTSHSIEVLSGAPEETYRLYGLRSTHRREMDKVKEAISRCDALIFPGGSIFQDVTSFKSVLYYSQLVKMAKGQKKKVLLLGQGVGPLKGFIGKSSAASAFNMADAIAVRDPQSVATLKSLGVKVQPRVTADSAFLLPPPPENDNQQGFNVGNMKSVGLSVRPHGKSKDVIQLFGEFTRLLYQNNYMPVLIEMDRNDDGPLIQEIAKSQGGKIPDLRKLQTPMQLQQRLRRMDALIGMRLHAGILAATVGIPPLMVSYDPKVAAFAKLLEIGTAPSIEGLTAQRLYDMFVQHMKDRERNEKLLERKIAELRKAAQLNIELLESTLRGVTT
ncbi:MAG TPA: polysaccharide pyruvyl transferase CsaB [Fimbriimonadaceae bacterium]|nr:polysaccharide pyruvyl transferase CsaB [Fimbriimonadaceae bacterium]